LVTREKIPFKDIGYGFSETLADVAGILQKTVDVIVRTVPEGSVKAGVFPKGVLKV